MTFVEALKLARPLIESEQQRYLCHALCETVFDNSERRMFVSAVHHLLHPFTFYTYWYGSNSVIGAEKKRLRLEWLDYMISKGKLCLPPRSYP